jgi:hypothetical protein
MFRRDRHPGDLDRPSKPLRPTVVAAVVAAVVAPVSAVAANATGWTIVPGGGAEHGDAAYCNGCDVIGVRNVQGGSNGDVNLDIGAGSEANPGNVSFNYDIGRCTQVWNGHKQPIATMCPDRVVFYVPVDFKQRVRLHRAGTASKHSSKP